MSDARHEAVHVFPLRVYYEDTDAGGVVYYANYLKFAERARSELLRRLGKDNTFLLREYGVLFAVTECAVKYRHSARLDDALEVHTRIRSVGGASLAAEQRVTRDGDTVVDIAVKVACVTPEGRPVRLPGPVRSALESLVQRH